MPIYKAFAKIEDMQDRVAIATARRIHKQKGHKYSPPRKGDTYKLTVTVLQPEPITPQQLQHLNNKYYPFVFEALP